MMFWDSLQSAAGMEGVLHWVILGLLLVALLLYGFIPSERTRVRTALLFFVFSIVGLIAAAMLLSAGAGPDHFGYRTIRWAALLLCGIAIVNLASVVLFDILLKALLLQPPRILRDLLLAIAYIAIALVLLSRNGFDLTGIVATSAVITAVIGFSLADTLGNIMGGMALQMEHTIEVGDWINVDGMEGRVKEIRWRQTSIETRNWDTIVIPNSVLMKTRVSLLGHREGAPRQQRRWVYFNVDFRFAPTAVVSAVEAALRAEPIPNVASEPEPHCILTDFKDSYATYAARYWATDLAATDPTDSVVRTRIYAALRRAGIPPSIPAQSIFLTEQNESRRERKESAEVEHRLRALEDVELFRKLTPEERRELAARLTVAPFVPGEALTKQGAVAHWLYIIVQGSAEVHISMNGRSEKVATLKAGDFFGEMALMTGEPRRATVVAASDIVCYRLDKAAFQQTLARRPEIAEDISHVLARRRVELEAVREGLNEEALRRRADHAQGALLDKIREFFGLDAE
ncbi:MAG TPA: mechanosensitive ion channel family protein [Verrucomicrobiae bacterium]|jgi:small-conductance mechanosensitive channel/CRP-like cAMP-binding protein|nr:mechanosensitive ion channel family protein [Verrucomicrobiae bacterium]